MLNKFNSNKSNWLKFSNKKGRSAPKKTGREPVPKIYCSIQNLKQVFSDVIHSRSSRTSSTTKKNQI
jgi:hypothetical protein